MIPNAGDRSSPTASSNAFRKRGRRGGSEAEKFVQIQLELLSNGSDAADLVETLLADPGIDASLQSRILSEVSPT